MIQIDVTISIDRARKSIVRSNPEQVERLT